jgi:hypothetical protein
LVFQHVPISVVSEVSKLPIPQLEAGSTPIDYQTIEDDGVPLLDQPDPFDFRQPEAEAAVTFEECRDVTMMIVNIPGMFGMSHLARDERQCAPFAKELHKYCERKGLDPRDWFFDEFGMCLTGFGLVGGMWRDHKEYKADHPKDGKKKKIDPGSGIDDSYNLAVPEEPEIPEARPEEAVETEGVGFGGRR